MRIQDFWNQAFIAALGRLPLHEAKAEADGALALCIEHWQQHSERLMMPVPHQWADGDVTLVRFTRRKPTKPAD